MLTQLQPMVVQSPDMARQRRIEQGRGIRTRAAILAELRRCEDAGWGAPTLAELATAVKKSESTVYGHLLLLLADAEDDRLVYRIGLRGGWALTRAGRLATNPK